MTQTHQVMLILFAVTIPAIAGCAPKMDPPPLTHQVKGKVVYKNGNPFTTGGTITFSHDTEQGITCTGEIKEDGTFTLHSITAQHKVAGAQVGTFLVTISPTTQDQTVPSINLKKKYEVTTGDNDLTIVIDE